jgi:hypothetical protein
VLTIWDDYRVEIEIDIAIMFHGNQIDSGVLDVYWSTYLAESNAWTQLSTNGRALMTTGEDFGTAFRARQMRTWCRTRHRTSAMLTRT